MQVYRELLMAWEIGFVGAGLDRKPHWALSLPTSCMSVALLSLQSRVSLSFQHRPSGPSTSEGSKGASESLVSGLQVSTVPSEPPWHGLSFGWEGESVSQVYSEYFAFSLGSVSSLCDASCR